MTRKSMKKNDRGAVAAFVAIMLVLIIICVALVVDLGHIHNVKVQMQRAVDAAALAGAQQLPDSTVAYDAALAMAGENILDNTRISDLISNDTIELDIDIGHWDLDALGDAASSRYDTNGTPENAVKVTATREVEHAFFFFVNGTQVTTDAIAVRQRLNMVLPFVVVSCIETVEGIGDSSCDIKLYRFSPAGDDNSAWSSLVWQLTPKETEKFLIPGEGADLFFDVVYGGPPENKAGGLEFSSVDHANPITPVSVPTNFAQPQDNAPACGDRNIQVNTGYPDTTTVCGLGQPFEDTPLGSLSSANLDTVDPLTYVNQSTLPRWDWYGDYTNNEGENRNSAFKNLLSMNGFLDSSTSQATLQALYNASIKWRDLGPVAAKPDFDALGVPDFMQDGRFARFIQNTGGSYDIEYNEILRYAGYPEIYSLPGSPDNLMESFRDAATDSNNHFVNTDLHWPFDGSEPSSNGTGETLRVQVPVIHIGTCDDVAFIGTPGGPDTFYVGPANFLITRLWDKNAAGCFDAATPVSNVASCPGVTFDPALMGGNSFACGVPFPSSLQAVEGLKLPPKGFIGDTELFKVVLVE